MKKLTIVCVTSCYFLLSAYSHAVEPITPLPSANELKLNQQKVQLGDSLFHDPRLSKDNSISCATCHTLSKGGTDQEVDSTGINGQHGGINSPTVFNSRYNFKQFWDGRAKDLAAQADGPVNNPKEMGSNWPEVIKKLKQDPSYVAQFKKLYPDGITSANVIDAIVEFEHSLVTPSRFDDYLKGDKTALTAQELHGYELFKSYGCTACHHGINIGGSMYQKMGLVNDYFKDRKTPITKADMGKFNVTGQAADKHVFKVPTLRNVELTPPYFHDGSVKTLDQAVKMMGKYQLGVNIPQADVNDIVAFLKSLTGKELIKTPPETDKTIKNEKSTLQ